MEIILNKKKSFNISLYTEENIVEGDTWYVISANVFDQIFSFLEEKSKGSALVLNEFDNSGITDNKFPELINPEINEKKELKFLHERDYNEIKKHCKINGEFPRKVISRPLIGSNNDPDRRLKLDIFPVLTETIIVDEDTGVLKRRKLLFSKRLPLEDFLCEILPEEDPDDFELSKIVFEEGQYVEDLFVSKMDLAGLQENESIKSINVLYKERDYKSCMGKFIEENYVAFLLLRKTPKSTAIPSFSKPITSPKRNKAGLFKETQKIDFFDSKEQKWRRGFVRNISRHEDIESEVIYHVCDENNKTFEVGPQFVANLGVRTGKENLELDRQNDNSASNKFGLIPKGLVGLKNLGHTCFMNSTLQCLSNAELLTEYFLAGKYKKDINRENPLGWHGKIAEKYGKLMEEIWTGDEKTVSPYYLKDKLGQFNQRFSGYNQQDSSELLFFLLDGIHEDLNLVKDKPLTVSVESNDRPDYMVAKEAWEVFLSRNRSIIVNLFMGQIKSTVKCPSCERVSTMFDPFQVLSLPLFSESSKTMRINVVASGPARMCLKMAIEVPKLGDIGDLLNRVGSQLQIPAERFVVIETFKNSVYKKFKKFDFLSMIDNNCEIFVFELAASNKNRFSNWCQNNNSSKDLKSDFDAGNRSIIFPCKLKGSDKTRSLISLQETHCFPTLSSNGWKSSSAWSPDEEKENRNLSSLKETDGGLQKEGAANFGGSKENDAEAPRGGELQGSEVSSVEQRDRNEGVLPDEASNPREINSYRSCLEEQSREDGLLEVEGGESSNEDKRGRCAKMEREELPVEEGNAKRKVKKEFKPESVKIERLLEEEKFDWEAEVSNYEEVVVFVNHSFQRSSSFDMGKREVEFGFPTPLTLPVQVLMPKAFVMEEIGKSLEPYLVRGKDGMIIQPEKVVVKHCSPYNYEQQRSRNKSTRSFELEHDLKISNENTSFLVCWTTENDLDFSFFTSPTTHPSFNQTQDNAFTISKKYKLSDCLDEYCKKETLTAQNTWYCGKCKDHKKAQKKLDLWSLPPICIIHLKRFQQNFNVREKLDVDIDFPINGLDLSQWLSESSPPQEYIYDLFAVSNHYGFMGGGHYTSFCKNPIDEQWYCYDDLSVTKISDVQETIVQSSAYVLFYKKRGLEKGILRRSFGI